MVIEIKTFQMKLMDRFDFRCKIIITYKLYIKIIVLEFNDRFEIFFLKSVIFFINFSKIILENSYLKPLFPLYS